MRGKNRKAKNKVLLLAFVGVLTASVSVGILLYESSKQEVSPPAAAPDLQTAVRQSLLKHGIDLKSVRTRQVKSSEGTFSRAELRVTVPATFSTLSFNYDLSREVALLGATVVATEKSEDKSVTMHVRKDGVIHQSIIFTIKKETN